MGQQNSRRQTRSLPWSVKANQAGIIWMLLLCIGEPACKEWTASSNYHFYWINRSDIWGFQVQAGGKGVRCLESKSKLTVGVRSIETCAHGESPSPSCRTRLWEGQGWPLIPLTPAIKLISNPFSPLWTNPKPNPEGFWHDGFSGPWSTRNSSRSCSDLTGSKIPNSP